MSAAAFARPAQPYRRTGKRTMAGQGHTACWGVREPRTRRGGRFLVAAAADGRVGDDCSGDGTEAVTQEPQPPPVGEVSAPSDSLVGAGGSAVGTSPPRRMAAARAAVAVMDNLKMKELEGQGFVRRPKTTRGAMVASLRQLEVEPKEADRIVATFVAAFGSVAFATKPQQAKDMDTIIDRFIAISEEDGEGKEAEGKDAPIVQAETRAVLSETVSEERAAEQMFENTLFQSAGWYSVPGAEELVALMQAKPNSTEFSEIFLKRFDLWIDRFNLGPANAEKRSPLWSGFQKIVPSVDNVDLRFQVAGAFQEAAVAVGEVALASGPGAAAIRRITAIKNVEEQLFSELGEPASFLNVGDADADAFTNEVLAGWCTVSESMRGASGLRLIRAKPIDEEMTSEQVATAMRKRLAESPLGQRVKAFLLDDVFAALNAMKEVEKNMRDTNGEFSDGGFGDGEMLGAVKPMVDVLFGAGKEACFMLVPVSVEPVNNSLAGPTGTTLLTLGAILSAATFSADTFGVNGVEFYDMVTAGGHSNMLLKIGSLVGMMFALTAARDITRLATGWANGMKFDAPGLFPSVETGILSTNLPLKSYPRDGKALFDVSIAPVIVGLASSAGALIVGLQMTAAASSQALAGFPSLPSELLQTSVFAGSLVDFFLHTQLRAADIAAARISMHPLAVAGVVSMLWNAANMLPLPGSSGQNAVVSLGRNNPLTSIAPYAGAIFVLFRLFGGRGDFFLTVMAANVVFNERGAPLLQEDNVTPVRDPGRIFLLLMATVVSLAVLSPMTVQTFLQASSMDSGAGAASVAAGLGVGGLGLNGLLGH